MKHTLFKDSIFIDHYECGELKRLVKEKLEEDKKNNQGQVLSNESGFQTFNFSNEFIQNKLLDWSSRTLKKETYIKSNLKIFLNNMWINENTKYCSNQVHNHPMCHFSGIYYVECPPDTGNLYFLKNDHSSSLTGLFTMFDKMKEFDNYQNVTNYESQFILFPSYLLHGVNQNLSNNRRISLAFNLNFVFK